MDRKKKIAIISLVLVIAVVAAVLGFLFLDKIVAQAICILAAMILAAVALVLSIEKSALHALMLAAAPIVSTPFLSFFANSELADRLGDWYNAGMTFVCQRMGMEIPSKIGNQKALVITFWIIFAVIYWIILRLLRWIEGKSADNSGGSMPDKDFPERNYQQKRKSFCRFLAKRIEIIDAETKWDQKTFTPIEAAVEMTDKHWKKRRYDDLQDCLRRHWRKNAVFLVLGDPGSGKSVSMRKLCTDMMKESEKTGLIPVYVDLKRWTGNWSLEHPPTEDDLVAFIERILREDGTTIEAQFLQDNFRKMLEWGQWYFVFDSFDEIPCLMGRKSSKKLIDRFSRLLYGFLTRENQRGGVIASRLFRSPTDPLHAAIKLHLQPLSDDRIQKMLNRYAKNADELIRNLFGSREDLVALCRNPFYLSLLIEYFHEHGANLPRNQLDLYENAIQSRLNGCAEDIDELGLKGVRQVLDATRLMALHMQESSEYGLECPLSELQRCCDGYEWEKILNLLRDVRLCRFGGAVPTASFAHRRFQEYFYVSSIMEKQICLDSESYSSIENNSGIRDALVLYCEIAPLEKSREIADHCWSILQQYKDVSDNIRSPGCVELVNTICFMAEAFRNRRQAMVHFQADFQQYTLKMLASREFVVQYAAVSSMVLFEQPQLREMVLKVLRLDNRYLSEVVMKNCRTMNEIPWEIIHRMAIYLAGMDRKTFTHQFRSMDFSFSISSRLWYVRLVHTVRLLYDLLTQAVIKIVNPLMLIWALALGYRLSDLLLSQDLSLTLDLNTLVCGFLCVGEMHCLTREITKQTGSVVKEVLELIFFVLLLPGAIAFAVASRRVWIYLPYSIVMVAYFLILKIPGGFYKQRRKKSRALSKIKFQNMKSFTGETCRESRQHRKKLHRWLQNEENQEIMKGCIVVAALELVICLVVVLAAFAVAALFEKLVAFIAPQINTEYVSGIAMAILLVVYYLAKIVSQMIEQRRWLQKKLCVDELERSELETNMEQHWLWDMFKKRYLEELIERKVKLTGEWTDGLRPETHQDDLDRLLAILDCADIENLRSNI